MEQLGKNIMCGVKNIVCGVKKPVEYGGVRMAEVYWVVVGNIYRVGEASSARVWF